MPRIVTIVLAAGASRRLAHLEQLLPVRGLPLVRTIVGEARAACDRVAVVVGASAGVVAPVLDDLDVTLLWNGGWREGVASSIRAGVRWAAAIDADAAILCTCDQPRLDRAHLARLIEASGGGTRAVASRYGREPGVPALYPRALFPALLALRGDHGTRPVLTPALELAWPDGAIELDARLATSDELAHVTGRTA